MMYLPFRIEQRKLRNVYDAAVDQGPAVIDADDAAPASLADQLTEPGLRETYTERYRRQRLSSHLAARSSARKRSVRIGRRVLIARE